MKKYIAHWFLLFALIFVACNDDDDAAVETPVEITPGSANFATYVALGNSLTAGFTDGAVFIAAQENSYPNIMAQQFALAGGNATFPQPLWDDNLGGALVGGVQAINNRFVFDGTGPVQLPGEPITEITNVITGPFNNLGVPGAKSFHLVAPNYGNPAGLGTTANAYFVRMASNPGATVLEDALAQNPTFFSLWIGNNDVLSYATSGGIGANQTGNLDPGTYGGNDITDPDLFGAIVSDMVTALTAGGATSGVIANIPYVNVIPYFTTVPHNPIELDAATAAGVNAGFEAYNMGLLAAEGAGEIGAEEREARTISFAEGFNAITIEDESLFDLSGFGLPNYRQATAADFPVLTSSGFIGTTVGGDPTLINGVTVPLADQWVLSETEVAEITVAVDAYNMHIANIAAAEGLALADMNAGLTELAENGIVFDDFILQNTFVTGGAFSLDGVHPAARGYAYVANVFIEAINSTYGSNLPLAAAADYPVAYSPFLQ